MKAQLIYFKESGKFYTNGSIELTKTEENGQYFDIGDRIRHLSASKQLPDIKGDWLAENGFIVVLQEDIGWSVLVKYSHNNLTIPTHSNQHKPGKDTNHKIRLLSFKPSGKFYIEKYITLDENCVNNGVIVIDNIVDKVSREDGFYYMICAPDDELSGCPHQKKKRYFYRDIAKSLQITAAYPFEAVVQECRNVGFQIFCPVTKSRKIVVKWNN